MLSAHFYDIALFATYNDQTQIYVTARMGCLMSSFNLLLTISTSSISKLRYRNVLNTATHCGLQNHQLKHVLDL